MQKKQNQISKFFLIVVILSAIVTSCTRDRQITPGNWGTKEISIHDTLGLPQVIR